MLDAAKKLIRRASPGDKVQPANKQTPPGGSKQPAPRPNSPEAGRTPATALSRREGNRTTPVAQSTPRRTAPSAATADGRLDGATTASRLEISARRSGDANVLEVAGELDAHTVNRLAAPLEDTVREGEGDVVVDLSKTRSIDSSGLHLLLNSLRRVTRQARKFVVVCPPGPVLKVLELSRLVETLAVVPSYKTYAASRS